MIKHDLIEQVGGIKRAREIVEGAPKEATHKNDVFGYVNFKWNVGGYAVFDEWCSDDAPVTQIYKTNWHENSTDMNIFKESSIDLNDLRTAIAEHEIAEIEAIEAHDTSDGDFEVWEEQQFEKFLKENDFPIRKGENGYRFSNQIVYEAWLESPELGLKRINELKSAEVKLPDSLKRLESDDCTDIRNHLSPSTRVVDL